MQFSIWEKSVTLAISSGDRVKEDRSIGKWRWLPSKEGLGSTDEMEKKVVMMRSSKMKSNCLRIRST